MTETMTKTVTKTVKKTKTKTAGQEGDQGLFSSSQHWRWIPICHIYLLQTLPILFLFSPNNSLWTINSYNWVFGSLINPHTYSKPFSLFPSLSTGVGSAFQPTCLPHEDVRWRRSTVRTSLKLEMAIWSYLMRTECDFIKNHCIYHSQNPRRHFWCISHLWCEAGAMIVKFRQKLRFQFTVFWSGSNWLPPKGQDFLFLLSHNQGAERQHGPPWRNAWEECQVGWREH